LDEKRYCIDIVTLLDARRLRSGSHQARTAAIGAWVANEAKIAVAALESEGRRSAAPSKPRAVFGAMRSCCEQLRT